MRLDDIVDKPAYSSFDYSEDEKQDTEHNLDVTDYDDIDSSVSGDSKYDAVSRVIMPSAVSISDSEEVSLVRDGKTVRTDQWGNMVKWLKNNWGQLMGKYYITKDTRVLHSFRISGKNKDED